MAVYDKNRIVINSIMLYIRMFVILIVSLYTVRLVLKALGVVDYGIYNVVGSVVSLFSFLSYTLSIATQRFFAIEIVKNDPERINQLYNLFLRLYLYLSLILAVLLEVVGLWLLYYHLNIPHERFWAAHIVFHASIIAFVFNILIVPNQALIIASERMNLFAIISIFEASLKLGIVLLLSLITFDKLVTYGLLVALASLLVTLVYFFSVRNLFKLSILRFWDKQQLIQIISFSGWNLFGSLASVINLHGINLLINIFFGPMLNAARGIAVQVNSLVSQFVLNFTTAVNPQITKLYAIGDRENMQKLVYQSSKFSFLLILVLVTPILFETETILVLWLNKLPAYTILFVKLIIINTLIDSISYPFQTAVQATGRIKYYQSVVGGLLLLNFPASYILYKIGFSVEYCFYVGILISFISLWIRLVILNRLLSFSIKYYLNSYLFRYLILFVLLIILYLARVKYLKDSSVFLSIPIEWLFLTILSYTIGCNNEERKFINQKIVFLFNKLKF